MVAALNSPDWKCPVRGPAIGFRRRNNQAARIDRAVEACGHAGELAVIPAVDTVTSVTQVDTRPAGEPPAIDAHATSHHRVRRPSFVCKSAANAICGLGVHGYTLALTAIADLLREANA